MFGGDDPFGFGVFGHMQRQMREMNQMMDAMMDPFGLRMGNMLEDGRPRLRAPERNLALGLPMSPFPGFGGFFSPMNQLQERAMQDPNSHVFMQSTMMTFDEHGRPRVVEKSTRKAGDIREDRRRIRDHDIDEMEIGHSIGNRRHYIEKKRDKDGNVRSQQRFENLDESDAVAFDREFHSRARSNLFSRYDGTNGRAITDGSSGRARNSRAATSSRTEDGPIITLPEEEETSRRRQEEQATHRGGPIIREISDEEADSSIPKRSRRDYF